MGLFSPVERRPTPLCTTLLFCFFSWQRTWKNCHYLLLLRLAVNLSTSRVDYASFFRQLVAPQGIRSTHVWDALRDLRLPLVTARSMLRSLAAILSEGRYSGIQTTPLVRRFIHIPFLSNHRRIGRGGDLTHPHHPTGFNVFSLTGFNVFSLTNPLFHKYIPRKWRFFRHSPLI